METCPNSCNRMKANGWACFSFNKRTTSSEVVARRRSEMDERISKSDIGITIF